jgi:hypothetical protein
VARRSCCDASLSRDFANKQNSLDGAAIGFQQVSPAVFQFKNRFRADLCAGEFPTEEGNQFTPPVSGGGQELHSGNATCTKTSQDLAQVRPSGASLCSFV